jgi:hypothetical protein
MELRKAEAATIKRVWDAAAIPRLPLVNVARMLPPMILARRLRRGLRREPSQF